MEGTVRTLLTDEELQGIWQQAALIGAREGVQAALKSLEKEKVKMKAESKDKRLRNTKLLLRNYRMLKANVDCSVYREEQIEESAVDILNNMISLHRNDEVIVDSIRRSATRTAIIVSHIDTMISLYEAYCEKSVNYLDARRYEVIYDTYISDEPLSAVEIADKHMMSKESVYVDIKIAVERLSALIFGIDGLDVN